MARSSLPQQLVRVALAALLLLVTGAAIAQAQPLPPPGAVLNLARWSLELPVRDVNETLKVFYNGTPSLANYSDPFYFYTTNAGNGTRAVVLKTPAGGYKASGSAYPRTELRHTLPSGSLAAFNISDRTTLRTLTVRGAVQQFTPAVPEVVIAQLRSVAGQQPSVPLLVKVVANATGLARPTNANNRVIVNYQGGRGGTLTSTYRLGDPYTLRISAGDNVIKVFWGSLTDPKLTFNVTPNTSTTAVFRAGNFLQTNLTLGDRATAYSEVWLYNVTINFAPLNASGNASANDTGSVRTNGVRVLRRRSAMARAMAFRLW